jgi:hypothetical protein
MSNPTLKMKNETPLVTVPSRFSLRKHAFYGILALVSLLGLAITQSAKASFIETINQVGTNVFATGSGTIDLGTLSFRATGNSGGSMQPSQAFIIIGAGANDSFGGGTEISGPVSFGGGTLIGASSSSGDPVGIWGVVHALNVPVNYMSGTPLSGSSTYNNATFASLGINPGTYTWTWGTGDHADSFTLQIGPARVPDTGSTLPLLGFASLGLVALRRKLRC